MENNDFDLNENNQFSETLASLIWGTNNCTCWHPIGLMGLISWRRARKRDDEGKVSATKRCTYICMEAHVYVHANITTMRQWCAMCVGLTVFNGALIKGQRLFTVAFVVRRVQLLLLQTGVVTWRNYRRSLH